MKKHKMTKEDMEKMMGGGMKKMPMHTPDMDKMMGGKMPKKQKPKRKRGR